MKKIEILRDTPFHEKGKVITVEEFRSAYQALIAKSVTDEEIIKHLNIESKLGSDRQRDIAYWFKVVGNAFAPGEWVWHNELQRAYHIVPEHFDMQPNQATISAVIVNPDTYTRYATPDEIDYYTLHKLPSKNNVLFGRNESYYFKHVWTPIGILKPVVSHYIAHVYKSTITVGGEKMEVYPAGLKVGCMTFTHDEIKQINKFINP